MLETPDGRHWSIYIHGPGLIKATDIMSPTGYSEWIRPDQLRERPRLKRWAERP